MGGDLKEVVEEVRWICGQGHSNRRNSRCNDLDRGTCQDRVAGEEVGDVSRMHHLGLVAHGRDFRFCSKYGWKPMEGLEQWSNAI